MLLTNLKRISSKWRRWGCVLAVLVAIACASQLGYAAWDRARWQEAIEWDFGTIENLCGGDTEKERLLEIRFIKKWEYKALKRTGDGKQVWIHWRLSKRHCGNWSLVDRAQAALIRPLDERFPNGVPDRGAVDCFGLPIDESEAARRLDLRLRNVR
jgi:hypothetical protein